MRTLDKVDIEGLVDPTFAIIAQHWESFTSEVQEQAHEMVSRLLKTHQGMIREMVNTIPSLGSIELLQKFEEELGKLRSQMDVKHQFQAFSQRCQKENAIVVSRALTELHEYLVSHQSFIHASALSEQPDPVISQLMRSLLNACVRFSESNPDMVNQCAKCLGLIGCLDPTSIEITEEAKSIFVLSNFERSDETIDFIVFFLEKILVKAFLSTADTRTQGMLGFAIQELLKNCGFDVSNTIRRDFQQPDILYKRWIAIPESIRNTLSPFVTSRYIVTLPPVAPLQSTQYPLYSSDMSHTAWLRRFVFDLMKEFNQENGHDRGMQPSGNAALTFSVCRRIIRGQDIAIPNFLLPFIALNIAVDGNEERRADITNELMHILSHPLPDGNHAGKENLLLCSQVSKLAII